jgi:hypothetical protein
VSLPIPAVTGSLTITVAIPADVKKGTGTLAVRGSAGSRTTASYRVTRGGSAAGIATSTPTAEPTATVAPPDSGAPTPLRRGFRGVAPHRPYPHGVGSMTQTEHKPMDGLPPTDLILNIQPNDKYGPCTYN